MMNGPLNFKIILKYYLEDVHQKLTQNYVGIIFLLQSSNYTELLKKILHNLWNRSFVVVFKITHH